MREDLATRQRRRRRRAEEAITSCRPRTKPLWWLAGGLLLATLGDVNAGRSDVSWPHTDGELGAATAMAVDAAGAMVVSGCSTGGGTFYVTKFSDRGQQLWREAIRVGDLVHDAEGGEAFTAVCASALSTDAALNIYVVGAMASDTDPSDVFVARLAPSGALVWTQTLGTPHADVATSLCVHDHGDGGSSVVVGGYSAGNLSLGRESPHNCGGTTPPSAEKEEACDDGFIVRLAAADGAVVWTQSVASLPSQGNVRSGETRVFGVVTVGAHELTTLSIVLVGETRGRLTPTGVPERHAGDVFVRRVALTTGVSLWTTQLSSTDDTAEFCQQLKSAAASSSSQYTRVYPRGHCGVALHATQQAISVVGTTRGLLSTIPSQQQSYQAVCGASTSTCVQCFVARLELMTGGIVWVRQAVDAANTAAEGILALPITQNDDEETDDVAVLASADAGFFASAESMEQLAVLRITGRDGLVRWTSELGLAGEDHAVAISVTRQNLVVAAHGSADKSQRGRASTQSYVRHLRMDDGAVVPLCVDTIGFDTSQANSTTSGNGEDPSTRRRSIVQVPLRRDEATRCVDATASVRYRYSIVLDSSPPTSSVAGLVAFTAAQTTASIAVAVPHDAVALRVSLDQVVDDSLVDEGSREWTLDLVNTAPDSQATGGSGDAADGRLWQQLTWVALVSAVVATALVVVAGRVVCWRASSAWSWRRAKLFHYSTLRLRRYKEESAAATQEVEEPGRAEETEELRSHLEEIQQLNDSLDGLLLAHLSTASSSSSSPRSAACVEPSPSSVSPRPKMSGWKRSLRRIGPASPKKR